MKTEVAGAAGRAPTHDEIAARAHQLFCDRGGLPGHEIDDWLQAEYELMQLPIREIAALPAPKPTRARGRAVHRSLVALVHTAMFASSSDLVGFLRR